MSSRNILQYDWEHYVRPQDCVIEVYHCIFCAFKEAHWGTMQDHYYYNHMEEVNDFPITRTDKVDYIIINGPKSFVPSRLE